MFRKLLHQNHARFPIIACFVLSLVSLLFPFPAHADDPTEPGIYAEFKTDDFRWLMRLEHKRAPKTVANFVALAEGSRQWIDFSTGSIVSKPFFPQTVFHRVISDFMIQGGSPTGASNGFPGYFFEDEFHQDLRHSKAGTLSMANSGPDTNGSQFFITVKPTPWLDDIHSVFGEVVEGLDHVIALSNIPTDASDKPINPVTLTSVRIFRVGEDAIQFLSSHDQFKFQSLTTIPNPSIHFIDNQVLQLAWNPENHSNFTLFWTRDFHSWNHLNLLSDSSINLLVPIANGQIARMQDLVPNNYFTIIAATP